MTPKQQRFVEEYLIDLNATQAAIRAGYSAKTAKQQGQRLLTNVDVATALTEAKTARSEETGINAAWVLTRLAQEAYADLADLYDEQGRVKPVKDWPLVWRQGLVAGVEVEAIGEGAGHVTKIKISDRIKRVELIGKHVDVRAFSERMEHTGKDGVSLADEMANAADRIRAKLDRLAEQ
ncbi:terminase small subunit [Sphingobium sp. CFD-1]|uniref:terminase small subunit n=1 Tax=Sphingobium sp. CFD-1 TaxID=2878545 RepID=UPI00214B65CD|nr:terminase small subunit [Sphingobium sp. CFD-1]